MLSRLKHNKVAPRLIRLVCVATLGTKKNGGARLVGRRAAPMAKPAAKGSGRAAKKPAGAKKAPQEPKKTKTQESRAAAAQAKAELEASKKALDAFAEEHFCVEEKDQSPPKRSRDVFAKVEKARSFNLKKCFGTGLLLLSAVGLCMLDVTAGAVLGSESLTTLMGQICARG